MCRTKSAAEELQKGTGNASAERLQQLREQAAAASSTLGERVQAAASTAQQLAKETVEELKKQNANAAGSTSQGTGSTEQEASGAMPAGASSSAEQQQQQGQQQQQQQQHAAGAESEAGQAAGAQAAAKPALGEKLRSFAAVAAREIVRVVQSEQASSSALRGASAKAGEVKTAGTDALAVSNVQQQQSAWQRQFEDMRSKVRRWAATYSW
jgi:hypothetical protein